MIVPGDNKAALAPVLEREQSIDFVAIDHIAMGLKAKVRALKLFTLPFAAPLTPVELDCSIYNQNSIFTQNKHPTHSITTKNTTLSPLDCEICFQ